MRVKYITALSSILCLLSLSCIPVEPPLPQKITAPKLIFKQMAVARNTFGEYHEAIQLQWHRSESDTLPVQSFTLMRKFSNDTTFELFDRSQHIPADTTNFFDELSADQFPASGSDSVFYLLFAIDTLGRPGDTSNFCRVFLLAQPTLASFSTNSLCIVWDSWVRGGVTSWCHIWPDSMESSCKSEPYELYPETDQAARFSACCQDQAYLLHLPPASIRWNYALFIRAGDNYSLSYGYQDAQ